jgi:hypothetical protein
MEVTSSEGVVSSVVEQVVSSEDKKFYADNREIIDKYNSEYKEFSLAFWAGFLSLHKKYIKKHSQLNCKWVDRFGDKAVPIFHFKENDYIRAVMMAMDMYLRK